MLRSALNQLISQRGPGFEPQERPIMNRKSPRLTRLLVVVALALALSTGLCAAQEITVAAAADLQFAMQEVSTRFQQESGKTLKMIYGSSGNFAQQLQNGAPFDMFFSANLDYPKQLEAAGLTEPGTFYQYATGKIVVWVPNDSKLDLGAGLRVVLDPAIKKIAIANPQHAPYGKAAVAAMQKENIYDQVKDKFVLGENISQTASFVASGSADVGIIALSLALSPNMKDKGRYAEVPAGDYPAIEQACVIMRSSKNKDIALQFEKFIRSPPIKELFKKYGFAIPNQ
jgi:molybdate transport system substrate-binding protein